MTDATLETRRTVLNAAKVRMGELADYVFEHTEGFVVSGPFENMKLPDQNSWGSGDVVPKSLGCYEAELHGAVETAIGRTPDLVINVGCAEGYYAIGLARRMPGTRVHAFDIDPQAQAVCRAAARDNGVHRSIAVAGECTAEHLTALAAGAERPLIVIDCEGAEMQLLAEAAMPHLAHADLIVECHDFLDRAITPTLTERLTPTHAVELILEGPRHPTAFEFLQPLSTLDRWLAVCEFRPETMHWLACWANRSGHNDNTGGM